jgi:hypothetical protein
MTTNPYPWRTIAWITLFATAMGFLETSVVVYLRALMYPGGFSFPFAPIQKSLALTEIIREAATIIMLVVAGIMAGKTSMTRFGYFLYAFAVWDIFYYIFLKLLLNWPPSFFTWDVLFLIPLVWVGPVLSPVIVSLTMILFFFIIIQKSLSKIKIAPGWKNWVLLVFGSFILIFSWAQDYSSFMLEHYSFRQIWNIPASDLMALSGLYYPRAFNWYLFGFGELIILCAILRYWKNSKKINPSLNSFYYVF